jgi:hypothetical protein
MIQPYVQSVDVEGETKLVYINGEFSHAARVGALLEVRQGVLERPWEKPVSVDEMSPTPAQLDVAERALTAAQAAVGQSTVYARVDLVAAPTGEPWLAELELVDPSLLLRVDPTGAERLARAIQAQARPHTDNG